MIIDPLPKKQKRYAARALHECSLLHEGTPVERTNTIIERAGFEGISLQRLVLRTGTNQNRLQQILEKMFSERQAVLMDREERRVVSLAVYENLQGKILQETRAYHEKFPLKEGLPKEEMKTTIGRFVNPKLFNMALKGLEKNGEIVINRENIRLPGHSVNLEGELKDLSGEISAL